MVAGKTGVQQGELGRKAIKSDYKAKTYYVPELF